MLALVSLAPDTDAHFEMSKEKFIIFFLSLQCTTVLTQLTFYSILVASFNCEIIDVLYLDNQNLKVLLKILT